MKQKTSCCYPATYFLTIDGEKSELLDNLYDDTSFCKMVEFCKKAVEFKHLLSVVELPLRECVPIDPEYPLPEIVIFLRSMSDNPETDMRTGILYGDYIQDFDTKKKYLHSTIPYFHICNADTMELIVTRDFSVFNSADLIKKKQRRKKQ